MLCGAAGFRIERRLDRRHRGAETRRHLLQHVIAADAEPVADDLHVGVAVAEMPGEPHQRERRPRRDLDQRLGLPGHQHDAAVVEHDAVAVAQRHRLVEVEQELGAALALEHDAAAMAVAGIEHHAVDRGGGIPEAGPADGPAALHGRTGSSVELSRC